MILYNFSRRTAVFESSDCQLQEHNDQNITIANSFWVITENENIT